MATALPYAEALVALGSNLGTPSQSLDLAHLAISQYPLTAVLARSTWKQTIPVGLPPDAPAFWNGAIKVSTSLTPKALLHELLATETRLGRQREAAANSPTKASYQSRPLDLDLLLYQNADGSLIRSDTSSKLIIPHPRMSFRRFVLESAVEVAPEMHHPICHANLASLLKRLDQASNRIVLVVPDRPRGDELIRAQGSSPAHQKEIQFDWLTDSSVTDRPIAHSATWQCQLTLANENGPPPKDVKLAVRWSPDPSIGAPWFEDFIGPKWNLDITASVSPAAEHVIACLQESIASM